MLAWALKLTPGRRVWALEGTGSFAAGLAGELASAGEDVVEVGALRRARGAKNDRLDALRAARTAMGRDGTGTTGSPRVGGLCEAIRALSATRPSVLVSRTKAINELKSLIVVAPEQLRAPLRSRSRDEQLASIEGMSATADTTVGDRITILTLQSITARIRFLTDQLADITPELARLIQAHPAGPAPPGRAGHHHLGCQHRDHHRLQRQHHRALRQAGAPPWLGRTPADASVHEVLRHGSVHDVVRQNRARSIATSHAHLRNALKCEEPPYADLWTP
jgi:hypothetical protein